MTAAQPPARRGRPKGSGKAGANGSPRSVGKATAGKATGARTGAKSGSSRKAATSQAGTPRKVGRPRKAPATADLAASIAYGEGSGRGSAKQTRKRILAAARLLFARSGMDGVSVRAIAEAAGVNHALVHRYFGSKMDMVCEIVQNEIAAFGQMSMPQPTGDLGKDLAKIRELFRHVIHNMKTTTMLILRAEIDGLNPSQLLQAPTPRGIGNLADWIAEQQRGNAHEGSAVLPDPQAVAMIISGAIFSLVAVEPWLASAVGLLGEPEEARRERQLDALMRMLAAAVGGRMP